MTTLRFPDTPVSDDVLAVIAGALGVPVTQLHMTTDADELRAGGWTYDRPLDDEDGTGDRTLAPGVTGFPAGSRWAGAR